MPTPLDAASLRELAFGYVAKFATSRARLLSYLGRKLRERGWAGDEPPDADKLVAELVDREFIDDSGYAAMKAGSILRRGYGGRRVAQMYYVDGIAEPDREQADGLVASEALSALLVHARKRRIGPYAAQPITDPKEREKAIARMLRAGHDYRLVRKLLDLAPGTGNDAIEQMLSD